MSFQMLAVGKLCRLSGIRKLIATLDHLFDHMLLGHTNLDLHYPQKRRPYATLYIKIYLEFKSSIC